MPIQKYKILIEDLGFKTEILYEERFGEFTKETVFGFTDQNVFRLETLIENPEIKQSFTIKTPSLLNWLTLKRNFDIKCRNNELTKLLSDSAFVHEIFFIAKQSSDISPEIVGNYNSKFNYYNITINYSTKSKNPELILAIINLVRDLYTKI